MARSTQLTADRTHPIDPLTRFGTRASLMTALEEAVRPESPPTLFVIFALDGFDEYVALFGQIAGRAVLSRLATQLSQMLAPIGTCFRPRSDEFAALIRTPITKVDPVLDAAVAALRERGQVVAVTASWGAAMLPEEAADPLGALKVADKRLLSNAPRRRRRNRRKS
jgi:GGDEF domain-containing protein